ncbi:hypothetical protein Nepgr_018670 [Nepenthes gracilis]|uniref:LOB domain-containing protein n=1 Tax=Nepenthes gracilis TaxID=150966 RepID=A0AAD3XU89_NEPGR|nr:hypothetical protein Nepgr_018670 [Nepenthes gracilis]
MTLKGGTSTACAACKYQRRRCTPECPLAPYFPADTPKIFQNAHRLFGVSNMRKLLGQLHPSQKNEAMDSIIYQANARERFPVQGCVEIIKQLWSQIQQWEEELHVVHAALVVHRHQLRREQQMSDSINSSSPSRLKLGMAPPVGTNNPAALLPYRDPQPYNAIPISQNHSYNNINAGYSLNYNVEPAPWINSSSNNNNGAVIQSRTDAPQPSMVEQEILQDYDEMQPYFDTTDDRQSYIDSKEDPSPEPPLKDETQSVEYVAENEFKSCCALQYSLSQLQNETEE